MPHAYLITNNRFLSIKRDASTNQLVFSTHTQNIYPLQVSMVSSPIPVSTPDPNYLSTVFCPEIPSPIEPPHFRSRDIFPTAVPFSSFKIEPLQFNSCFKIIPLHRASLPRCSYVQIFPLAVPHRSVSPCFKFFSHCSSCVHSLLPDFSRPGAARQGRGAPPAPTCRRRGAPLRRLPVLDQR
jgi:hypothetical protein